MENAAHAKQSSPAAMVSPALRVLPGMTLPMTPSDVLIEGLAHDVEQDRDDLLARIERNLRRYILNAGPAERLSLLERGAGGGVRRLYRPSPFDLDYGKALLALLRRRRSAGRPLDSLITEPCVAIVVIELERFFLARLEILSSRLAHGLTHDARFIRSVCADVVDQHAGSIPRAMRNQVIALLVNRVGTDIDRHIGAETFFGLNTALPEAARTAAATAGAQCFPSLALCLSSCPDGVAATLAILTWRQARIATKAKLAMAAGAACLGALALADHVAGGPGVAAALLAALGVSLWLSHGAARLRERMADLAATWMTDALAERFHRTTVVILKSALERVKEQTAAFVAAQLSQDIEKGSFTRDLFGGSR